MSAGPKKFEQYKYFSLIAWTLIIGSTLFVANLAMDLRQTADELQTTSMNLNQRIQDTEALLEARRYESSTSTAR